MASASLIFNNKKYKKYKYYYIKIVLLVFIVLIVFLVYRDADVDWGLSYRMSRPCSMPL